MKLLLRKWRNRSIAWMSDFIMIIVSWMGTFLLFPSSSFNSEVLKLIPFLILMQSLSFSLCGLYRGLWRFASIPDFIRILRSVIVGTCFIILILRFEQLALSEAMLLIYALILILLLSGPRVLFRWMRDYRQLFTTGKRVLIVGAGNAGEGIARDLRRLPYKKYQAVGFVDDNPTSWGLDIHGVRVYGPCTNLPTLISKLKIELILIAMPSATSIEMRKIVNLCEQAKIPFRTLPGLKDLADGTVSLSVLRKVLLEDLLGREQAELDIEKIRCSLTGKKILVTGGGGSIGAELCRQIVMQSPAALFIVDNNEFNLYSIDLELRKQYPDLELHCQLLSVTDRVGVRSIFSKLKPHFVYHAAAYKHVPLLENQLRVAMNNNIIGTRIVAEMASEYGVEKFVLISTDKAVNPTNVMGATKRASEVFCQNKNFYSTTKFITVRFGNVLDSAGSVVPLFRKQLSSGGPITVTHPEITRFFMTIPEASQLILQAVAMGEGGEIFVLDMGEPIKIRYLAEQMIKLSGKVLGKDIDILYTGLRPGEKLHEELFHEAEELISTTHTKINRAKVRRCDWQFLIHMLDKIELTFETYNEYLLKTYLSQLVPEYENKNLQMNTNLMSEEPCSDPSLSYV